MKECRALGSVAMVLISVLALAACATTPMGPTVQVMPAANKPFAMFVADQDACKQHAQTQVAGQADAANRQAVGIGALTTALGAAGGAAVGNGTGASIGAVGGAAVGAAAGGAANSSGQASIQAQYDNAYVQCMYAKGNQVPGMPPVGYQPPPESSPAPSDSALPAMVGHGGGSGSGAMSVTQMQVKLNAMGFPVGRPDGKMGPKTKEQLTQFQKSRGIPETGQLDSATIAEFNN